MRWLLKQSRDETIELTAATPEINCKVFIDLTRQSCAVSVHWNCSILECLSAHGPLDQTESTCSSPSSVTCSSWHLGSGAAWVPEGASPAASGTWELRLFTWWPNITDTLYFWKSSINILLLQKFISLSSPGTPISISSFSFCLPTVGFGLQELVNSILFLIWEAVYPIWVLWTLQSKRAPKCANSGGAGPRVPGCELSCAVQGNLAQSWTWALNLFR